MEKIIKLAVTDFKLIFRDPSLNAFFALPLILFGLVIWFLPGLVERYEFLVPYLPVFLVVCVVENTQLFSFISSMVLIDEKESEVARIYGIVPMNKTQYFLSRLAIPYLFTVLLNIILLAVQPFYAIPWAANLVISFLTALVVPVYVLGLNSIVENRMEGLVYVKAFNMIVLVPIAAFFVPEGFRHFFGILPTHWIFQALEKITQNEPFLLFAAIGFLFFGLLLTWTGRLFLRKHFL